jgi:hypothetical protein
MPGDRWLSFARAWFAPATMAHTIEPLVADWRHELAQARGSRRWLVVARGHLALGRSVGSCLLRDLPRPLPLGVGPAAWIVAEIFAALGTFIIGLLVAWSAPRESIWLLIPANLAVALPLAAVPLLIIVTRRWNVEPRAARWLGVRTALVMTAVMVVLAGWIMPDFNQQWRERAVGRDVGRPVTVGFREMTLSQLVTPAVGEANERARRREVHNRLSVIAMPISLTILGLAVSRRVWRVLSGAVGWWILAAFLWFTVLPLANTYLGRSPVAHLAPWSPHLVLLLLSRGLAARQRHEQAALAR